MNRMYKSLSIFFLSFLCFVLPAVGQQNYEMNKLLSSLRGKWEWHNYWNVQTFNFQSDSLVLYNRLPGVYSIQDNKLTILTEKDSVVLPFTFKGNQLLVTSTKGKVLPFTKQDNGFAELYLVNTFFSGQDTTGNGPEFIFQENGSFVYYPAAPPIDSGKNTSSGSAASNGKTGVYRVDQNNIHLTLDDGTLEGALIRNRGEDDMVDEIVYNNQNFFRPLPQTPIDTSYVPRPPVPGGGYPYSDPPVLLVMPQTGGYYSGGSSGGSTQSNGSANTEKRRTVGSTRPNPQPEGQKTDTSGTRTGGRKKP